MDESSERIHLTTFGAIGVFALAAAFTGLFVGLAVVGLAWAGGAAKVWLWGVVSWTLCQAAAWLWLLSRWASLIIPLERLTGWDLNRDGQIGEALPPPFVKIILDQPLPGGNDHSIIANVPCVQSKLIELASGIMRGEPLSEEAWCGSGKPFSKDEFKAVRAELVKRKMLAWRNPSAPAQGLIVTMAGLAAFRYFSSLSSSPLPQLENRGKRER
jgi:hypothetical protein